ncbi:GNAT family N-acetyltransferase [Kribbella endophytica]
MDMVALAEAAEGNLTRGPTLVKLQRDNSPVATGVLYVDGEAGELVSGATRPEYRGRGAQSALVARRTQDALAAGCRWVFSETGKPGPGEQKPSLDNLGRAGLQVIYDRPIWVWKA